MRITISRAALLPLLSRIKGSADPKSAMPVLANILLTATRGPLNSANGSLTAQATDLYRASTGTCDAEVNEPGGICAPAHDLHERVKAMPDGPMILEDDDAHRLTIRAVKGARKTAIACIAATEWPRMPEIDPASDATEVPAAALSLLFARTLFSVSDDTTRPQVNCLRVEIAHDRIRAVSTDGHRLSLADHALPGCGRADWMIPLVAATELARLVGEHEEGNVRITSFGPWLFFAVAGISFGTKMADAQFPPYEQVIPAAGDAAKVDREQAIAAIRFASLADRAAAVRLSFAATEIAVRQETAASGSAEDVIPCVDAWGGKAFTVGACASYMLAPLSALDVGEVTLTVGGPLDPICIRPVGLPDGQAYVAVVMPMRI